MEFAKEHGVEQIILGLKHRSKLGKFILGSNAQYVVLNAHCPVTRVK